MPLSPCLEKPLNSKVIKSFVPEQRSRYVFFEFRDPCVLCYIYIYIYIYIYEHYMSISHIAVCGYGTQFRKSFKVSVKIRVLFYVLFLFFFF